MRYKPDHGGVARLLREERMGEAMEAYAKAGAKYAAHIAPRETGEYRDSFGTEHHVSEKRQTAVLFNTADHAPAVEWGTFNQDGHHVLSRTIDWIEGAG